MNFHPGHPQHTALKRETDNENYRLNRQTTMAYMDSVQLEIFFFAFYAYLLFKTATPTVLRGVAMDATKLHWRA